MTGAQLLAALQALPKSHLRLTVTGMDLEGCALNLGKPFVGYRKPDFGEECPKSEPGAQRVLILSDEPPTTDAEWWGEDGPPKTKGGAS